jgi:predicted NAD/FAD-binding protein
MRVAIVGSGIAGLTVAHHLHREHEITVFEGGAQAGGHTHTVDVEDEAGHLAVDMGFIVYNERTYPLFSALLRELGVASQPSRMSFSLRCERSGLEYNGTSLNALFAQRRNLLRPSFLHMLLDILRFNARSTRLLATLDDRTTLAAYLEAHGYGKEFRERYILPMGRALWSAAERAIMDFPVRFFVDFFHRHGFLTVNDRPQWRAIPGGSREYVRRLTAPFATRIRLSTPVAGIQRLPHQVLLRTARGHVEHFDHVFLACHSDQALRLLADPSEEERRILGAFPYQANEVVLHTDSSLLPRQPLARAAWNYHLLSEPREAVAVTYCMNTLQSLPTRNPYLVTLNRTEAIDPRRVIRRVQFSHPVYTPAGVAAQQRHSEISGVRRTSYCGAYWRCGFHEDGVWSAFEALARFERARCEPQRLARAG